MTNCALCHTDLPDEFFRPTGRPNLREPAPLLPTCKLCRLAARSKKARKDEQEDSPYYRERVFQAYGYRCNCAGCPETLPEFLTIDHVNGGGTQERKRFGTGVGFYKHIIRQNYPNTYQILCMNCNWAKGRFGKCPHLKTEEKDG